MQDCRDISYVIRLIYIFRRAEKVRLFFGRERKINMRKIALDVGDKTVGIAVSEYRLTLRHREL